MPVRTFKLKVVWRWRSDSVFRQNEIYEFTNSSSVCLGARCSKQRAHAKSCIWTAKWGATPRHQQWTWVPPASRSPSGWSPSARLARNASSTKTGAPKEYLYSPTTPIGLCISTWKTKMATTSFFSGEGKGNHLLMYQADCSGFRLANSTLKLALLLEFSKTASIDQVCHPYENCCTVLGRVPQSPTRLIRDYWDSSPRFLTRRTAWV